MDGRALCYSAFSLVMPLHKSYKDGVNSPSAAERQAVRRSVWPWSPVRPSMAINLLLTMMDTRARLEAGQL
jgi:hypothetical protein